MRFVSLSDNLICEEEKDLDCLNMIKDISMPSDPIAYIRDRKHTSLKDVCRDFVDKFEKEFIKKSLEVTRWNRKKTAILLDISYKSLLDKIRLYELN